MATTVSESVAMQCGNFASHSTLRMPAGRVVATDPRRRQLLNTNSIYSALRVAILPSHRSSLAPKLLKSPKARRHSLESARCVSTYVIQSKIKRRVTTAKRPNRPCKTHPLLVYERAALPTCNHPRARSKQPCLAIPSSQAKRRQRCLRRVPSRTSLECQPRRGTFLKGQLLTNSKSIPPIRVSSL